MISVCLTTYNGSKYIKEQIESILVQINFNDELIISDDSSTDDTVDIIKSINDHRIRLYEKMTFKHYTPNFEFAISKAKGDFIFLSDQDDIWLPNKVEVMIRNLHFYDLVVSDCYVVDKNLRIINESFYNGNLKRNGFIRNLIHNHFLGCTIAFKKKLTNFILPFPKKILSHESWIGLNAEFYCTTKFIEDKLILYRRHENNHSNTLKGSTLTLKQKLSYRYHIVKNILLNSIIKK
jgi:glycosyltransferase involved in cell wall biosynthesis